MDGLTSESGIGTSPYRIVFVASTEPPKSVRAAFEAATVDVTITHRAVGQRDLETLDLEAADCLVVTDTGTDPLSILEYVRSRDERFPVVLYVADGSESLASDAIGAGVTDYLPQSRPAADLVERATAAISDHRAATNAAKKAKYSREVASAANDVLWMVSPDWEEHLFLNSRYEDVWGQEIGALQEQPDQFFEAIHPDDRERARDAATRLSDGEAVELELRVNEAEDYGRIIHLRGEPIFDDDGAVSRLVGYTRDITERREREAELERIRDFFSEAEDLGDLGAWELEPDGSVNWTDGCYRIHGVDHSYDPCESNVLPFFADEDRERLERALERARTTGEPYDLEVRHDPPAGETRWVRTRARRVEVTDEGPRIRGFIQDITDQREREEALRAAKAELETAVEAGAVGTWIWDVQADTITAGTAFARTFGIDPDRAREGVSIERFTAAICEADRERVVQSIEDAIASGGEYEETYRLATPRGEPARWIYARGRVETDDDGTPVRFPGIAIDITDVRRADDADGATDLDNG
ncbi:PAS domain-containing protein [Halovivax limisalsi]|uniref:PAS domain-containing protein n=1 Tax=Halovivax limisalsi TaxID=1453760 RepID=UPI001FFCEA80|nr:PAS domain-containing protein [Halovivax limisalsi]